MVFNDRPTYQDRHARISSWPEDPLQLKAGYIDADFLHPQTFPCTQTADHTFSVASMSAQRCSHLPTLATDSRKVHRSEHDHCYMYLANQPIRCSGCPHV